jgi:hypothetical protein
MKRADDLFSLREEEDIFANYEDLNEDLGEGA